MKRKLIVLFTVFTLLLSIVPVNVFADEVNTVAEETVIPEEKTEEKVIKEEPKEEKEEVKENTSKATIEEEKDSEEPEAPEEPEIIKVTKIKLNYSSITTVKLKKTYKIKVTVYPKNATDKTYKFSSSNTKVASVNSKGVVTTKGRGKANITVKANDGSGIKKTVTVKVIVPVSKIKLNKTKLNLKIGKKYNLNSN